VLSGEQIYITTKARIRKGTLLDGSLFRRMLDCSKVSDVARVLMSTYYANFLPYDAETLHRDRIEFLLTNVISSEAQSFFSSAGQERRAFLKLWYERQDILLIKRKVWEIYAGKSESDIKDEAYKDLSSLNFSLIDKQKLLSSTRIDDVIASVKNKKLVAYMQENMKRSVKGKSPELMIGFALDTFQNSRLFDAAKGFSGEEKLRLLSLVGTDIDIINITSIYRSKKYYNMSDKDALSMVINSRYRIDSTKLKLIASLPPERMWEPLAGTQYTLLLPIDKGKDDVSAVEITRRSRGIGRANAIKTFRSRSAGIHFVLAYLMLREIEVLDISAIIEIVRYNYDRKKAEKFLAYPLAGGW
jgi:V/A-type H+-transporting ATPase subunit C